MPQTDSPEGPPVPPMDEPTVVGIVRNHYYKKHAIGVEVAADQTIPRGCRLRGLNIGPDAAHATFCADSIQLNRTDVPAGEAGQEIGIGMEPPFPPKGTKLILV